MPPRPPSDVFRPKLPLDPFAVLDQSQPWHARLRSLAPTPQPHTILVLGAPTPADLAPLTSSPHLAHSLLIMATHTPPPIPPLAPGAPGPTIIVLHLPGPLAAHDSGALRLANLIERAERVAYRWLCLEPRAAPRIQQLAEEHPGGEFTVSEPVELAPTVRPSPNPLGPVLMPSSLGTASPLARPYARSPLSETDSDTESTVSMSSSVSSVASGLSTASSSRSLGSRIRIRQQQHKPSFGVKPSKHQHDHHPFTALINFLPSALPDKALLKNAILVTTLAAPFLTPVPPLTGFASTITKLKLPKIPKRSHVFERHASRSSSLAASAASSSTSLSSKAATPRKKKRKSIFANIATSFSSPPSPTTPSMMSSATMLVAGPDDQGGVTSSPNLSLSSRSTHSQSSRTRTRSRLSVFFSSGAKSADSLFAERPGKAKLKEADPSPPTPPLPASLTARRPRIVHVLPYSASYHASNSVAHTPLSSASSSSSLLVAAGGPRAPARSSPPSSRSSSPSLSPPSAYTFQHRHRATTNPTVPQMPYPAPSRSYSGSFATRTSSGGAAGPVALGGRREKKTKLVQGIEQFLLSFAYPLSLPPSLASENSLPPSRRSSVVMTSGSLPDISNGLAASGENTVGNAGAGSDGRSSGRGLEVNLGDGAAHPIPFLVPAGLLGWNCAVREQEEGNSTLVLPSVSGDEQLMISLGELVLIGALDKVACGYTYGRGDSLSEKKRSDEVEDSVWPRAWISDGGDVCVTLDGDSAERTNEQANGNVNALSTVIVPVPIPPPIPPPIAAASVHTKREQREEEKMEEVGKPHRVPGLGQEESPEKWQKWKSKNARRNEAGLPTPPESSSSMDGSSEGSQREEPEVVEDESSKEDAGIVDAERPRSTRPFVDTRPQGDEGVHRRGEGDVSSFDSSTGDKPKTFADTSIAGLSPARSHERSPKSKKRSLLIGGQSKALGDVDGGAGNGDGGVSALERKYDADRKWGGCTRGDDGEAFSAIPRAGQQDRYSSLPHSISDVAGSDERVTNNASGTAPVGWLPRGEDKMRSIYRPEAERRDESNHALSETDHAGEHGGDKGKRFSFGKLLRRLVPV